MTKKEAVELWVQRDMDGIPQSLIVKAYLESGHYDDIIEVTPPSKYDRAYIFSERKEGEIVEYDFDEEKYRIRTDDGELLFLEEDEFEVRRDDFLPMWGRMWMFNEHIDEEWLEKNLQIVADCGFRIYEIEEGYLFGIDGAGYSFYDEHWIPLYEARGLKWHSDEPECEAV